ncbi:hypothetical protein CAMRE0001_1173 [Campylobacter rectus RM3267]|uniref:Uncharacterized protein n=1 Tax=Campylobacter rectus RM3267 TaxID=553218 RepID=B9D0G9_CAMRE|nr:hypothetical protein CAMRE0001_1173 [Campylobacter rectus RM3267]
MPVKPKCPLLAKFRREFRCLFASLHGFVSASKSGVFWCLRQSSMFICGQVLRSWGAGGNEACSPLKFFRVNLSKANAARKDARVRPGRIYLYPRSQISPLAVSGFIVTSSKSFLKLALSLFLFVGRGMIFSLKFAYFCPCKCSSGLNFIRV